MSNLNQAVLEERKRYSAAAGGGVSLPVAGAVYWAVIGVLGFYLDPGEWAYAAAAGSGLIFPLGLLLQGPLRSPFMKTKSPLSGITMAAIIAINLLWPVHVVLISVYPDAAPLSLAIGMTLHWPLIGWAYASRVCMAHAIIRTAVVTLIWFGLPELRFTGIPFAVSALYVFAAMGLSWESGRFRAQLAPAV